MENLKDKIIDFTFANGPKIGAAIVIVIAGLIMARWLERMVARALQKKEMEPPVRMLISRIVYLLVLGFMLVIALGTAGVNVMALVAGIGVAGVGIGLAMQGVLSNLFAGLTIIFTKPFKVGEYIEMVGVEGQVKSIDLFTTTLLHGDLSLVVIPNRKVVGEILHNYGGIRQLNLTVGVAYSNNVDDVMAIVREILAQNPRVLKEPAPGIGIAALGDAISISIQPWTKLGEGGPAQKEIYHAVVERFRAKNIGGPVPRRDVKFLNPQPQ